MRAAKNKSRARKERERERERERKSKVFLKNEKTLKSKKKRINCGSNSILRAIQKNTQTDRER